MTSLRILVACVSMFALTLIACSDDDSGGKPEICNNLVDDDLDGYTDCFDSDCMSAANCQTTTEICNNTIDDDGDTLIDCNDPDCASAANCQTTTEICNNSTDDDGDTLVDCDDPDCASDANCQGGTCEDPLDLVAQDGCDANQKCAIIDQAGNIDCVADGSSADYSDCTSTGDTCLAGAGCFSSDGGTSFACLPFCDTAASTNTCPGGGVCGAQTTVSGGNIGLCLPPDSCNLYDYDTVCEANEGCYLANLTTGDTICGTAGTKTVGQSCSAANDCAAGLGCAGATPVCVEWCTASSSCTTGTCQGIGDLPAPNTDVGICAE